MQNCCATQIQLATMEKDWANELHCYSGVLMKLAVHRVAVSDTLLPRKYADLANHPERIYYLASFKKEVDSFHKHWTTESPDIDIKDIPPDIILQLMPIWHKQYEGLDFFKFKCQRLA